MVLELLADAPKIAGGTGSAAAYGRDHLRDQHPALVHCLRSPPGHGDSGRAPSRRRHLPSNKSSTLIWWVSLVLKAFAFDQRKERKDAHDLVYCIEHAPEGLDGAVEMFRDTLKGVHHAVVRDTLAILRNRFAPDHAIEGYRKDGPVAVARFELGEGAEARCARSANPATTRSQRCDRAAPGSDSVRRRYDAEGCLPFSGHRRTRGQAETACVMSVRAAVLCVRRHPSTSYGRPRPRPFRPEKSQRPGPPAPQQLLRLAPLSPVTAARSGVTVQLRRLLADSLLR